MKKISRIILLVMAIVLSLSIFSFAAGPYIGDNYPQVYDLRWSNRTARWSVDGKANKYEVRLYRDGRRVTTKTQTTKSRSFSSEMVRGNHEYYFEVRPYNSVTGWGDWEQSDSIYTDSRDYYPVIPVNPINPVNPVYPSNGPGETTNIAAPQIIYNPAGQWIFANNVWHFLYANGVYASNSWILYANKWYYIDINTAMSTGFVTINSTTYYFNPDGTMVTGTIILNGITHYFDANGKMIY